MFEKGRNIKCVFERERREKERGERKKERGERIVENSCHVRHPCLPSLGS